MKNCSKCGKTTSNTTIVPNNGSITHLCTDCTELHYEEQEKAMLTAVKHSIIADCVQC